MLDLARVRADTRAAERLIHLNNAGASLMPAPVADAVRGYLGDEERMGGYEAAAARADDLERFYGAAARLLGCSAREIAFATNATEAWSRAFYGLPMRAGDRVLTTASEYASNAVAYAHRAARDGIEVVFVPDDAHGQIDVDALRERIDERTALISLNHVPSGDGVVHPAAQVGRVARAAGVPFLLDACQSAGQLPLDVDAIGCDVLSAAGRKYLRGPRGTGLLYVREAMLDRLQPIVLDNHSAPLVSASAYRLRGDARRFETWEQPLAAKAGLAVALDYACDLGLDAVRARVQALAARLRAALAQIDGVRVLDRGVERSGIVTFGHEQADAHALRGALHERGVNTSVATRAWNRVPFERRGLPDIVRASVHYFNTEAEVDAAAGHVAEIVRRT